MMPCACFQMIREKCRPFPVCWKVAKTNGSRISQTFMNIAMRYMKVIRHIVSVCCICRRAKLSSFQEVCKEQPCRTLRNSKSKLQQGQGLTRDQRWGPRRYVACVVCAERRWSEELIPTFIAGEKSDYQKEEKVSALLDPKTYTTTWQEVPAEEVLQSCPLLKLKSGPRRLLLHKRRVTKAMCEGEAPAPLCKECRRCLVKNPPEMPVRALANGKWLGRHPELMRRMPYGHRLLLPLRRVILTIFFYGQFQKSMGEISFGLWLGWCYYHR